MRIVALLLTVMMMTGTAAQVYAQADVAGAVDDTPDLVMVRAPEPVAIARPDHRPSAPIEAPLAAPGRPHAVTIFRPPR